MGLQLVTLTLVLLTQLVQGSQVVGTYNLMLDPGRIYWWKTKWMANPIDISKSNSGSTGVTITFNINPSTSLTNGIFEVTFPGTGFTFASLTPANVYSASSNVVQKSGVTYLAGQDTSISFGPISLPTASGGVGPFALRSRYKPGGQVIDCNLSFGVIYITAQEGTLTNAAVTFVPNLSSNIVNRAGNQLSFKFSIARDLWKYDFFKITTSQYFTLVMSNDYMCYSAYSGGYINNFNGSRAANPFYLDCVASLPTTSSSVQTLWIYGMTTDLIEVSVKDNTFVDLRVPGFTNPSRHLDAATYSWTIETVRFGTTNTLESVKVTGPTTTTDNIASITWKPTWGMSTQLITSTSLTLYMDIILVLTNPVPSGGTIEITFTDSTAAVGTTNFPVFPDIGMDTIGTVTSSTLLTVSGFDSLKAGATVALRYLATTGVPAAGKSMTVAVVTKFSDTKPIDSSSGLASIATTTTANIALSMGFKAYSDATNALAASAAGGAYTGTQYVTFWWSGSLASTSVNIYCPLSSALDDFQIYIPEANPTVRADTAVGSVAGILGSTGSGTAVGISTTVSKTIGSMTTSTIGVPVLTPGKIAFTNSLTNAGAFAVYSTTMKLPLVTNDLITAYECRIEAGTTVGVAQFTIGSQTATASYAYFCWKVQVAGAPFRVTFQPLVVDLYTSTSVKTYFLEINLPTATYSTAWHGSGLTSSGDYPMDSNLSTGATMKIYSDTTGSISHRITGLGAITTTSSAVQIFFPVGSVTDSVSTTLTITGNTNTFFTYNNELRTTKTRHYTHGVPSTTGAMTFGATDGTTLLTPTITSGGSFITGTTTTSSSPLTLTATLGSAITGDTYFYLVLPRGFAFSALRDVLSSYPTTGSSFPEKRFFSSPGPNFAFPGVLVKQAYTGTQIFTTATTISIIGLISPLGIVATTQATFIHGALSGSLAAACAYKSDSTATTLGMSVTTGSITTLVVSPSTIQGKGPKGVDINQTIQLTLPHGIDTGGTIAIKISSDWTWTTLSSCTVSGVNQNVAGTAMCSAPSSQYIYISNFVGFDKVTNQAITVYVNRLLPPDAPLQNGSSQFVLDCYTKSSSSIGSGVLIDQCTIYTQTIVTILTSITVGQSTFQAINFYPPHAGSIEADLYIRFTLPFDAPIDSIIAITVPYATTTTTTSLTGQNKCWVSPITYSACAVTSTITITLGQAYTALTALEVFVRRSYLTPLDLPTVAQGTVYGFKVVVTWDVGNIITDPTIASTTTTTSSSTTVVSSIYASSYATRLVVPASKVTTLITAATPAISFDPRNAGELSTFKISFKVTAAYSDSDYLNIIWPDEFDAYIGEATEMLTQDPGNFYLPCTSSQLGALVWCSVDHWTMIVKGTQAVTAGSQIDITVQSVRNPVELTTGTFRVLHYNVNNTLIEYNNNLGSVVVTSVPGFLEIRALNVSQNFLSKSADYSLLVYGIGSLDSSTKLKLQFPKEYDLSLVDQKDSYTCTTQWVDKTNSATSIKVPQDWNSGASCDQVNNVVTMSSPSVTRTFTTASYIVWNITSVMSPVWGYPRIRSLSTQDFDIQDWDVWTIYSYWTSKFIVFTYTTASSIPKYLQRSYHHATGAYLGFMSKSRTINVNGYNPLDKSNRVVVWPGTQTTDMTITTANATWPMEAKVLSLTPSTNTRTPDNSALKYTSNAHGFKILQEEWQINFRVAASIDAVKGLYYISWKLDETPQPGVTGSLYVPPTPTLVEIAPKVLGRYWFSISTVPAVSVGGTSVPIKVSVSNSPHTEATITIAVQTIDSVVPSPKTLTFRPDVTEMYFYLSVNSTHDVSIYPSVVVVFSLSGTDAAAFAIQPAIVVPIQSKSLYSTGNIAKIGISNIARTSVSIAPTTDQLGVLYYMLQPKGSAIPSISDIKALIPTFIKTDSDFSATAANNLQTRSSFQSDPQTGETWQDFQVRLYLSHAATFRTYGAIPMVTTVTNTPIALTGLWADTSYQIVAYFDNFNTNETAVASRIEYFDTLTTHDCQPVYVRFQYTVDDVYGAGVYNTLAKYLGVNPVRLISRARSLEKFSTRELQTTTTGSVTNSTSNAAFTVFSATILPNRGIETPTPTTIATLSNEAVDRMQADFITNGLLNKMWNYGPLAIPTRTQPLWDRVPQIQRFSNTTIIPEFLSTTAGKSCCVALLDTNANLKPEQVYRLYNYNWTQAIGVCIDTDITQSINSLQLTGLQPDTNYYIHCIATDNYPLWPTQMTYTSTLPIPFIPIHTPVDLEIHYELSQASGLQLLLLGLLALLH